MFKFETSNQVKLGYLIYIPIQDDLMDDIPGQPTCDLSQEIPLIFCVK